MDLGPPSKKRGAAAAAASSAAENPNVVESESKLNHMICTVQVMERNRVAMGAIYLPCQLSITILQPCITTVKNFANLTRGKSKHGLGHPHTQLWATFLSSIVSAVKSIKKEEEDVNLNTVEEAQAAYKEAGIANAGRYIAQARVRACKDEKTGIVMWKLSELADPGDAAKLNRALASLIEQVLEGQVMQGGEPAGPAERKLQSDINLPKKKLGKD